LQQVFILRYIRTNRNSVSIIKTALSLRKKITMTEQATDLFLTFYMQIMAAISGAGIGAAIWLLMQDITYPLWFVTDWIKKRYGNKSILYACIMDYPFVICGAVGLLVSVFPFMGVRFALFSTSGALVLGYILIRYIKKLP
jgi:hypothetical protein